MADILIIDDDDQIGRLLCSFMTQRGHRSEYRLSLDDGVRQAHDHPYDVVFLDVHLPDGNGLDRLSEIRRTASEPEVIIITGLGGPDGAEMAIKSGAWDYIQKGAPLEAIALTLSRALDYRREKQRPRPPVALKRERILGNSPPIQTCLERLAYASSSEASVLITGETGTGKDLFAQAVHENSSRARGPFVVVDCAALPETLVASVLFGYEKGAFTGADQARAGLVIQAHQGTLFLDEVGELPLSMQKSFLRVLQEHRFRPLGGKNEKASDFRLVSSTNRDLDALAEQGRFRKDLLHRLRSLSIQLPSLRERSSDLRELTVHFVAAICERQGKETKGFSPDFIETLSAYTWPGNVRELLSVLEEAVLKAGNTPTLYPKHLPDRLRAQVMRSALMGEEPGPIESPVEPFSNYRDALAAKTVEWERGYLLELMGRVKGDIRAACEISRLSRTALYARLKRHGIVRDLARWTVRAR